MNNLFLNTLQELRKGVVVGELSDELLFAEVTTQLELVMGKI